MGIIIGIIVIMFLVLLAWVWHSLGNIEKTTKIKCIIIGFIIVYILTFIIFNISKIGIVYENKEVMKSIRRIFVIIFAIINGYLILPYVFKTLDKINNEDIKKEKVTNSIIILLIIIVILFIFECIYLGNMQEGIINIIMSKK